MTKSLGVLSRSVVNRNVKIQDIDSLSLPRILKNECFENTTFDRCDHEPQSLKPCGCCNTPRYDNWCTSKCRKCTLISMYSQTLPEIPMDAKWLALPSRKSLLKLYQSAIGEKRQMLEACLNTIRFDDGLYKIHEWIRRFMFYRLKHSWYYLSLDVHCLKNFIEAMKNKDIVILPYGCVSNDGYFSWYSDHGCLESHKRQMIVVIKNNKQLLSNFPKRNFWSWTCEYKSIRIRDVKHFIETINELCTNTHYSMTPIITHGIWWMFLLVPQGYFDNSLRNCQIKEIESIKNCVVLFDPLHQRIGDKITNLQKHIEDNRGFVYWFDGQVLDVKEMDNVPPFITQYPKKEFITWCISRGINTLINLNGYKLNYDDDYNFFNAMAHLYEKDSSDD